MSATSRLKNPYVGPRPFQPGEKLYGRDQEIMDLLDLLIAERIVLLYSPSGAGKTSLIQAGLNPELEAEEFQVLPVMRVSLEPPPGQLVERPSGFNRYVLSLLLSLEEGLPEEQQTPIAELAGMTLAEYLDYRQGRELGVQNLDFAVGESEAEPTGALRSSEDSSGEIGDFAAKSRFCTPETDSSTRVVLIFDQFEEILTIDPADQEVKADFFAQVGTALRHPDRWALFSMREEFPAALDPYRRYLPTRLSTTFRLELLDKEAALQAIQKPAHQAGMPFTDAAATKLVDDLRRVRVQQPNGVMIERPGLYVEPVQLQVVCHRLWKQLPDGATEIQEADVQEAGDVDTALAGYYADRVSAIAQEAGVRERAIREWFLHHLITGQGIRGQVVREPEQTQGLSNEAIELLVDAHLVRAEYRRGVTWYELAHDRLIEPVQLDNFDWLQEHLSLLQREAALWELQDRSRGLLLHDESLEEAEHWADEHQDELIPTEQEFLAASREAQVRTRRERRNNLLIRGLAIVASIIMCMALFFYFKAEARRKDAERLSFVSIAQQLMSAVVRQQQDDLRVLLVRQAYLFNQRGRGNVLDQVDRELRNSLSSSIFSRALQLDAEVMSVALSPDGQFLASGSGDGNVQLFNLHEPASSSVILQGHNGPVCSIAFSPDGQRLASSGWDSTVRLWDIQDPDSTPIILDGHEKAVFSVVFSPDGQTLASGSWDNTVRLWDLQNLQAAPRILSGHEAGVNSVAFNPDGKMVASGSSDGTIRLWDLQHPGLQARVLRFREQAPPMGPQPPGTPSSDKRRPSPPGRRREPSRQPQANQDPMNPLPDSSIPSPGINAIAFSPDGQTLAAGDSDNIIRLWSVHNPTRAPVTLEGHTEEVLAITFSPDGQTLASGGWDRTIQLWDLEGSDTHPRVLRGHKDLVFSLAFSSDGQRLASGSGDHTVRLWDLQPSESLVLTLRPPQPENMSPLPKLPESEVPDRSRSRETQPPVLASEPPTRRPEGPDDIASALVLTAPIPQAIEALLFSQDSDIIFAINEESFVRTWDVKAHETAFTMLDTHKRKATAVAINSNSKMLAIGGDDGIVYIWNMNNLEAPPVLLKGHTGMITALALSAEGTTLASGGEDKTIRIWDLHALDEPPLVLRGHEGTLRSLVFNPQKMLLASGGEDNVVRLWNLRLSEYPPLVLPHKEAISSLVFSPDGNTLVSGTDSGEIRLWSLHNLRTDLTWMIKFGFDFTLLHGHESPVPSLAFSPDSNTLASGSPGMIYLWDLRNLEANPIKLGESLEPPQALESVQRREAQGSDDKLAQPAEAGLPPNPEAETGKQRPQIQALAFSPDGQRLASGSQDGTVQIWTLTAVLAEEVCQKVWRNLTLDEWQQFVGKGIPYEQTCLELK